MRAPSPETLPATTWLKYLAVFVVAGIVGPVLILFYQLRIAGCAGYGYGPDTYLAQCALKTYGDYEHGALGLKIDGRAIDHLERAEVVVLGHSHSLVGFSAPPTREYFKTKGIRFYNASLSGDYDEFFDFFLSRVPLRAKVLVIDVAPFFTGGTMSSAGRFIVEHPVRAVVEYRIKQAWQAIHRYACAATWPIPRLLCGNTFSSFRSAIDGRLIIDYTLAFGSPLPKRPVTRAVHDVSADNELRIKLAKQFFARHHLNAACTILTAVPTVGDFSDSAEAIARALNAPYINPSIDGLTVIDGAHLDMPSATAWSQQFWLEATPVIDRCLK